MNSSIVSLKRIFAAFAFSAAVCSSIHAASITVPNGSFESPSTLPVGVSTVIDSWQKGPQPAYFNPATFGLNWDQTSGIFFDSNPYANHDGTQCAYMLSFPGNTLFQDYNSSPTHDFNSTFGVGQSYTMTLGVFGKSMATGDTLQLSLYYRDNANNAITIGSPTSITYNPASFPLTTPLNLVDFSVTVPTVQASDAWAGKNIGVMIQVANGNFNGYWDMDNLRLTTVPEPGVGSLIGLGLCGLVAARRRSSQANSSR